MPECLFRVPFPERVSRSGTSWRNPGLFPIATPSLTTNSLGRVRVVPFQNVSLYGIRLRFWPIFSARSGEERQSVLASAEETGRGKTRGHSCGLGDGPRSSSLRGALALSTGISPYLLQMLTRAPLATRSWNEKVVVMMAPATSLAITTVRCSTNPMHVLYSAVLTG